MQHLPPTFVRLLESEPLVVQKHMLAALLDNIALLEGANLPPAPSAPRNKPVPKPTARDEVSAFVEHVSNPGIDKNLAQAILNELNALDLASGKPEKVKTMWLSPSSESYNYANVINNPSPINNSPNICRLLSIVNSHPSSTADADACLVSFFPSNNASLALHKDDEDLISQSSSICTVSFGASRTLEFVRDGKKKKGRKDLTPDLSLPATDCSMNIMKPGAQAIMKHRVPKGNLSKDGLDTRFSLSFRKIDVMTEDTCPTPENHEHVTRGRILRFMI